MAPQLCRIAESPTASTTMTGPGAGCGPGTRRAGGVPQGPAPEGRLRRSCDDDTHDLPPSVADPTSTVRRSVTTSGESGPTTASSRSTDRCGSARGALCGRCGWRRACSVAAIASRRVAAPHERRPRGGARPVGPAPVSHARPRTGPSTWRRRQGTLSQPPGRPADRPTLPTIAAHVSGSAGRLGQPGRRGSRSDSRTPSRGRDRQGPSAPRPPRPAPRRREDHHPSTGTRRARPAWPRPSQRRRPPPRHAGPGAQQRPAVEPAARGVAAGEHRSHRVWPPPGGHRFVPSRARRRARRAHRHRGKARQLFGGASGPRQPRSSRWPPHSPHRHSART